MKIRKWVDMGAEVDIDVGVDDVRAAMAEAFGVVTADRLGEPGPNRAEIFMAINDIAVFLKAITDAQISMMTFGQLDKIQHFLREQCDRFNEPLVRQAAYERGEVLTNSKPDGG